MKENDEAAVLKREFFIIMTEHAGFPSKRYETWEEADREAILLLKATRQPVHILRSHQTLEPPQEYLRVNYINK